MSKDIIELKEEDFIFVFGSNLLGIHGAGAALYAKNYRGAHYSVPEGFLGTSYALPTKKTPSLKMDLNDLKHHVNNFIQFAYDNPNLKFQVTRVGCGLSGFNDKDVIPLFKEAPSNCYLPGTWLRQNNQKLYRIIIAGSRTIIDQDTIFKYLDHLLKNIKDTGEIEIISGLAKGIDTIGLHYGIENNYKNIGFPANWDIHKNQAGYIRNILMSWYGTHLVAFWDGISNGTQHMINTATDNKLIVRTIKL